MTERIELSPHCRETCWTDTHWKEGKHRNLVPAKLGHHMHVHVIVGRMGGEIWERMRWMRVWVRGGVRK